MNLTLLMLIFMMFMANSPIVSIFILIMISLLISISIVNITNSSWLTFIIFLMIVGGMLILFIYMASITPNNKSFNFSKNITIKSSILMMTFFFLQQTNHYFYKMNSSLSIYSMLKNTPLMIFSVSILFLFLLMLMLIITKKEGPLRSA